MTDETTVTSEAPSHDGVRATFERAYDLLNERDPAHVARIFTEDVVFEDDAWPETVRGHEQMKRFLTAIWTAFPDFHFELIEGPYLGADGDHASVRVRVTATMNGPLDPPGFAPTMSTEYGGFYELEGERIRYARIIINMNDAAVQLGAAPAPGSRGERAAVLLQRAQARWMRRRAA